MPTTWLSICALTLSLISLVISFLNHVRDAAKVRAWCEIVTHQGYPNPDKAVPRLIVRVANLGRRPVVLLKLAIHGKSRRWYRQIKEPSLPTMTNANFREVLDQSLEQVLAQYASVKLLEGEVLDLAFWPNEATDFIFTEDGPMDSAEALYIVDCTGKKYHVKGDAAGLKSLLDAFWDRQVQPHG